MRFDEDEMRLDEKQWDKMKLNEMRSNDMRWDDGVKMRSDEIRRDKNNRYDVKWSMLIPTCEVGGGVTGSHVVYSDSGSMSSTLTAVGDTVMATHHTHTGAIGLGTEH